LKLLLCERTGDWAVALRRELTAAGPRLWESRHLADAWSDLAQTPNAFLVVELTARNAEDLLRRMAWLGGDYPAARIAVVAQRPLADYEWLCREAGAVHFTSSPRHLAPLAELAVRHLARLPLPPQPLTDRIWAGLPWGQRNAG
jgi:hypothetical protein